MPGTSVERAEAGETASAYASSTRCRSCEALGLAPVLDLGAQPLANALRRREQLELPEPSFPLALALCPECSLLQILESIPPEELFEDYPYFSSFVEALVVNARELAQRVIEEDGLGAASLAMEIASNDGYLLQHYRDTGVPVLGIEPARNIAAVAEDHGIPTRCEFFDEDLASELVGEGLRPAVVHANNVLAHVPNLNGFVAGIAHLIGDWGRAIIEVPYAKDFVDRCAFDTIYHEHLCYFSVTALEPLFERHGLVIEDIERIPIHGESLRLFLRGAQGASGLGPSARRLLEEEASWGVGSPDPYREFAQRVREIEAELKALLGEFKEQGSRVVAYGAAAKGSTLLNTFGLGQETLDFVVDASPHKQGLHMPGSGLPIRAPAALLEEMPDYVLVLAWNVVAEIMEHQREYRERGGRFVVPIPEPGIVDDPG